ncbi:hypothetical protein QBC36DRAFT_348861 [Triangularia setosa]|uniref:NmrA-like domain-containing protein n=1 Tax=Triangularia setosa TaxID=2587417 RepID=A0AAN6W0T6_9PEZI|nr:hypothetical protein QBC36DRAFT_348861 [Podospora setosa]
MSEANSENAEARVRLWGGIGASGHIGAAVLRALHATQPELSIRALVRRLEDVDHLEPLYHGAVPSVLGSLEDVDIVAKEAAKAQLAISGLRPRLRPPPLHPLHLPSLQPLPPKVPHTNLRCSPYLFPSLRINPHPKTWDDITDLNALPTDTTHASENMAISTFPGIHPLSHHAAIVSPTLVIGKSPSVRHKHPITFPDLMHVTREHEWVFFLEEGRNITTFVDTEDLAELYVLLVNNAVGYIQGEKAVGEDIWGEKSMREFTLHWLLPALERNEEGRKWLGNQEGKQVKELEFDEVVGCIAGRLNGQGVELWSRHIAEGFGTTMRLRGLRGKKYLGWEPRGEVKLDEAVEAVVRYFDRLEGN